MIVIIFSFSIAGCAGSKPNIYVPGQQPPPVKLPNQPPVAVVLGGGGARGYAHVGVLSVLEEEHIPINLIVGSSAGSMMGAFYADNPDSDALAKVVLPAGFWDFADVANTPSLSGVVQGYHLERFMKDHLRSRVFSELKIPLVVVTTNLKTGEPYLIRSGPIPPAVVASSAIPGVVKPANLYGHMLVDGGVAASVPVNIAEQFNPKMIIAVDIGTKLSPRIPVMRKMIILRSCSIVSDELTAYQLKGADIVIHPELGGQSAFDVSEKYTAYAAGVEAARKMMPEIKRIMKRKHIAYKK